MRTPRFLLPLLLFVLPLQAAQLHLTTSGNAEEPDLTQQRFSSASIDIQHVLPSIEVDVQSRDGNDYATLHWAGSAVSGQIGEPQLPVWRTWIEVPYGATVTVSASEPVWQSYTLDQLGADHLMPVQPPRDKSLRAPAPFVINEAAYSQRGFGGTPIAQVVDEVSLRGHTLALIEVAPVQVNPAEGELRIAPELQLTVTSAGGDLVETERRAQRYTTPQLRQLLNRLTGDPLDDLDELPASLGVLIISEDNNSYLEAIEPLVEWKRQRGFIVDVVTTSDIGSSTTQIKSYIQEQYDNGDIPPSFVMLIGDTPGIPHWTGSGEGNPATDLNYAQLDGNDYIPDLGISRLPAANLTDLENMVAKILQHDQATWEGGDDWINHAVFMASVDNYNISEGTHNSVINSYLDPLGYEYDRLYQVTYNATTSDVTASHNAGRLLSTYSGHGATDYWADGPEFHQSDVEALTNTVYPFVQSYACVTGTFTDDECFAETWVRTDNGAVAFMGSSVNSYWDEDDIMERRVYEALFANETPGDTYNLTWINGMVDYAKLELLEHYGSTPSVRRYFEMYNIMGDGSLDIWTTPPQAVVVDAPGAFFLGMTDLSITTADVPSWALVSVRSDMEPEVAASGYLDESGSIAITLPTAPSQPGNLLITITGPNIAPQSIEVPITASDGPYVVADDVAFDDAEQWNENGSIDCGETVILSLMLENVGVDAATDLDATISCEDNYLTIVQATADVSDIEAGAQGMVENGFTVQVSPSTPNGTICRLIVAVANGETTWNSSVNLPISAPEVATGPVTIEDPTGNGNNWPDPGETVDLIFQATNSGVAPFYAANASLFSLDPNITVTSEDVEIEEMQPSTGTMLTYTISISPTTPQDHTVRLLLTLGNDNCSASSEMELLVGDPLFAPSGPDAYGYMAYDMHDGGWATPFEWVELDPASGGSGTDVGIDEDDQVVARQLPFDFHYYGESFSSISICSNGWLSMGATTEDDYSNSGIPNEDGPSAMLAPFWEDLNPEEPNFGGVFEWYDEENGRFIVEYSSVPQWSPASALETFQVIFYDPAVHETPTGDGKIVFQYNSISTSFDEDGTVGIESPTETDGIQYMFAEEGSEYDPNANEITNGFTITFVAGSNQPLNAPYRLSASLDDETGVVSLTWLFEEGVNEARVWGRGDDHEGNREGKLVPDSNPDDTPDQPMVDELDEFQEFCVYRAMNGGSMILIGTGDETAWSDTLQDAGSYTYCVSALHDLGESATSNTAEVTWVIDSVGDPGNQLPTEFAIRAAYPNPFNPTLHVVVAVPHAAPLKAVVYDLLGRKVATLTDNRPFQPGYHMLSWTPQGSSGVYFVRLEAGNEWQAMRKVVFVK
ncbi:T9SS type A sorting domain-containing protein [bacterium]|nr:T9SS type A sorting domain-containing protein [bacterium]